ncbi:MULTISPECIES: DUF86 domain-containing protein [unclassified Methanoculleus]|jgi:uncharacterized protein with HEPN domain|uniref:HepT-like ribonuclease domain-containing protein n=1 Tax=unclassified Methanoculleus TaxID=2619537 RepID=UPI0025DBB57E|nr:HepT-like ribonuclease domain-containing protein [Methanoculleus sp. UBA377]MDD2474161.1 DUF86 domain-containing protein [Methanoculleus sp.]
MTPEDLAYLHHILDAIISIEEFSENIISAEDLRNRRLERAGIERMLTIIGEAAKMVSPELRREHPEIPTHLLLNRDIAAGRKPGVNLLGEDGPASALLVEDGIMPAPHPCRIIPLCRLQRPGHPPPSSQSSVGARRGS